MKESRNGSGNRQSRNILVPELLLSTFDTLVARAVETNGKEFCPQGTLSKIPR